MFEFNREEGSSIEVLNPILVELDVEEFLQTKGAEKLVKRLRNRQIAPLIQKCRQLVEPKAAYKFVKVMNIEKDEVRLNSGDVLKGIILGDMLEDEQTIVPCVATIGPRLEKQASEEAKHSIIRAWILERIGDYALSKTVAYVRSIVEERLGSAVSSFSPGSGTGKLFGIEQQRILFRILEPHKNIRVRLTPSYLMVPRKSSSRIFAATRQEYVACQYCPRKCEFRGNAFRGEYASLHCEHKTQ